MEVLADIICNWRHREFAVAIAITTSTVVAALYLPMVGLLVSIFVPLPFLFYRSKLGRSSGALILIAVTFIAVFMMGSRSMIQALFFFELGLAGLILSEAFEMNLSVEKTVAVTTGVVVITAATILTFYSIFFTNSLWQLLSDYFKSKLHLALSVYREMNVSEEQIGIVSQSMEGILYVVLRILPAIAVALTLFVVWSNLLIARPLLRSRHLFYPDFGELNEWKAPEPMVWGVIASGILLIIPCEGLKILGLNGLIIMMMIYFFQGIAIVSFYFEKKRFPPVLRGVLYGIIAMQQVVLFLIVAMGFFDMWVDFRRMKKEPKKQNEGNTQRNS